MMRLTKCTFNTTTGGQAGSNSGKRHYLLGHSLAAAVWALHPALFDVRDVESPGELLFVILTDKNALGHGHSSAI